MTPQPKDEKMTDEAMRQFKQQIKDWLTQNNFTQKQLSEKLNVTHGAVRNWLSSNYTIGDSYVKLIRELMANPEEMKQRKDGEDVFKLKVIMPYSANMSMWRAAAQVKDVCFKEDGPLGTDAMKFAKWSTAVINNAIREELRKHKPEEIKKKAKQILLYNDPESSVDEAYRCRNREDDEELLMEAAAERCEHGIPVRLPVLDNRINNLYLSIAANFACKAEDDFIAEALNEASDSEFDEALTAFLSTEVSV